MRAEHRLLTGGPADSTRSPRFAVMGASRLDGAVHAPTELPPKAGSSGQPWTGWRTGQAAAEGGGYQVTLAVPSFNQGRFIEKTLESIFAQDVRVEVFVADGGSTDDTRAIIERWASRLAGYRSEPDRGQSAAVNEAIARGSAPFVGWLNSDDYLLPGGLARLVTALDAAPDAPAAYGRVLNDRGGRRRELAAAPFCARRLARRNLVAQPGTLVRRSAWAGVGGLREDLDMAMDYDLWWRLYRRYGPLEFVDAVVAVNRDHPDCKTNRSRRQHYREVMDVLRTHYGGIPLIWWLKTPYSVWFRGAKAAIRRRRTEIQATEGNASPGFGSQRGGGNS